MQKKLFTPALFFWIMLLFVIFTMEYPKSLTQATFFQLFIFFTPLYMALTLTINLIVKNILRCLIIAFGLIILLILRALDSLNLVTGILTILAVGLLVSYFRDFRITKPKLKNFD